MNTFTLLIIGYLSLSILLNFIGPLAKIINSEFEKIDNQMLSEQVLKGDKKKIKVKFVRAKIILRLLTITFFPLFLIVLFISKKQDKKRFENQAKQPLNEIKIDVQKPKGLFFKGLPGFGEMECKDCGYTEKIPVHLHSGKSRTKSYQCQDCGHFQIVVSYVDKKMGKLPVCEKCGGELSRKEVLFCPNCKSNNLTYMLNYMT